MSYRRPPLNKRSIEKLYEFVDEIVDEAYAQLRQRSPSPPRVRMRTIDPEIARRNAEIAQWNAEQAEIRALRQYYLDRKDEDERGDEESSPLIIPRITTPSFSPDNQFDFLTRSSYVSQSDDVQIVDDVPVITISDDSYLPTQIESQTPILSNGHNPYCGCAICEPRSPGTIAWNLRWRAQMLPDDDEYGPRRTQSQTEYESTFATTTADSMSAFTAPFQLQSGFVFEPPYDDDPTQSQT